MTINPEKAHREQQAVRRIIDRALRRKITKIEVIMSYSTEHAWVVKLRVYSEGAKRPSYETVNIPH